MEESHLLSNRSDEIILGGISILEELAAEEGGGEAME